MGIRGVGGSLAEAFEQAALAVTAAVTEPARVAAQRRVDVQCAAPDDELLLVDWLNALIYEMGKRGMLFGRFAVRVDAGRLDASAWGEPVDVEKHDPVVEVKGATYTALRVARQPDGGWCAECVVDV